MNGLDKEHATEPVPFPVPHSVRPSAPALVGVTLGALLVCVAAFMNWGESLGSTTRGTEADGLITLILAIVLLVVVIAGARRPWLGVPSMVIGALIAVVAIGNATWDKARFGTQVGPGLTFTAIGGVAIVVVGLVMSARQARVEAHAIRFGAATRAIGPTAAALVGVAGVALGALFAWWVGTT